MDKFEIIKHNLDQIIIFLELEGFSDDIALLMLNTLKLIEDLNELNEDQAYWLHQKIQTIDKYIQNIKGDILTKIQDKEKELTLIDDIIKNLQEII